MSSSALDHHDSLFQDLHETTYLLPHDGKELARLEEQARHISVMMDNEVVRSPIDPSKPDLRVLDIGCGTGIVTNSMGTRFKDGMVYGLDLTPPFDVDERPPNVQFLKGNVCTQRPTEWAAADNTHPLTEDEKSFDLTFGRLLICGMTDWPAFISSQYQLLKPGGYLEIQDIEWKWYGKSVNELSDMWSWWLEMGKSKGLDYACGPKCRQWMEDAGFVNITVEEYRWPWGGQGQATPEMDTFGKFSAATIPRLCWNAAVEIAGGTEAPKEKIRSMKEDMRKDFALENGQYMKYYVTVGHKAS